MTRKGDNKISLFVWLSAAANCYVMSLPRIIRKKVESLLAEQ